ncbi:MAG: hypothetical protein RIC16_14910 [Rhodospirillales bacterium]
MLDDPHYRAAGYPYVLLDRSFIMDGGTHRYLEPGDPLADFTGRKPVLAVGSNMSPLQLARKFPNAEHGAIPVTRVRLRDFDSVYSTHFTSYGAIPATLYPSPGTVVTLFITWLNAEQEDRMHETEVASENYGFCRLDDIEMEIEAGPAGGASTGLDYLFAYVSSRGALEIGGEPVPLAEVPAENRRWRAVGQLDMQGHAQRLLAPDMTLHDFIRENIADAERRRERTDALHRTALAFERDGVVRVDV